MTNSNIKQAKIALVGATGLVGNIMMRILEERGFGDCTFIPCASVKSVGKTVVFAEKNYTVISVEEAIDLSPDMALFSAGGAASLQYAPLFAQKGTVVIDNSSAWRSDPQIPLVVPQINGHLITKNDKIIANPNCSTIGLVMALAPLHSAFTIKRVVVSTYQSVTGTGRAAVNQLMCERQNLPCEKVYPHPIDLNVIPHGGSFEPNGYTAEEMKLVNETRKILNDNTIQLTATVVRVPVTGGHSLSANIEFEKDFQLDEVYQLLKKMPGVVVMDNPAQAEYPTPLHAQNKDEVFVGRIRRDFSQPRSLNLWIVTDNLRKGAATNAIDIAEKIRK